MQPRKRGRPPKLQGKNRSRQNPAQQRRHRQLQQQLQREQQLDQQQQQRPDTIHTDESPGFCFGMGELDDPATSAMWVPGVDGQATAPITPAEVDGMMHDADEPFWARSEDAVASSSSQPPFQHQQFTASPDQVQQLHQLQQSVSPGGTHSLPQSVTIKQEIQEIQPHRQQSGQYLQQPPHSLPKTPHRHPSSHQNAQRIRQALSQAEQRQLFHLQRQTSSQNQSPRQQHHLLSQQLAVRPRSLSPQARQSISHKGIPHTTLAPGQTTPQLASSSQQQPRARIQTAMSPAYTDESVADREMYVRQASEIAERAKLEHRIHLKEIQRAKELEADTRGEPLSAKDKERERSRRESAVTRKRAEIYILELEKTARRVPSLEKQLVALRFELVHLRGALLQGHHQPRVQLPVASAMTGIPCSEGVKTEPGLVLSPNSTKATKVLSELKDLDL